jgi:hypothetical protein
MPGRVAEMEQDLAGGKLPFGRVLGQELAGVF